MERLQNAHFTPIDIPLISAIIAPVVKGYFCYRIWTLNKRSSKVCIVIAVVRVQCPPYPNHPNSESGLAYSLLCYNQPGQYGVQLRQVVHNTHENPHI
jgi:hypothetical protein